MKAFFNKLSKVIVSSGLIFIVTLLGAWGGQEKKWLRRFMLPAVVTIYAYFLLQNFWVLSCYLMAFPLSIGYGLPEHIRKDSPSGFYKPDEGSALGRFWDKIFNGSELWANIFTRGTVGLLISLTILSVPILTNNWVSYFLGSVGIILIWAFNSWQAYGETKLTLFGKEISLLNVDLVTYAVTALGIVLIINGWIK